MTPLRDRTKPTGALSQPTISARDAIGSWLDVLERMLNLPRDQRRAIRAELEDHLRNRVDDLMMTGMSEPEATRVAVGELGETAELARGFRRAAKAGKRITMMQAAAIATMGGLLTLGAATFLAPNNQPEAEEAGLAPAGQHTPVGKLPMDPEDFYNGELRRYDVSDLIHAGAPLEQSDEAERLYDALMTLAFSEGDMSADEEVKEPTLMVLGQTLFIRADDEFHQQAAWVLASLKKAAHQQQEQVARMEDEQRERMHMERERAERERHERIAELRVQYAELTGRLRDHQERRQARFEAYEKMLRGQGVDHPASVGQINDRYQMEHYDEVLQFEDLMQRIERVRALLLDAEYGQPQMTYGRSTGMSSDVQRYNNARMNDPFTAPRGRMGYGAGTGEFTPPIESVPGASSGRGASRR